MVHVKMTKKMTKTVDGKEVTVDRQCTAEQSQVPLMEKSGWSIVGKKPVDAEAADGGGEGGDPTKKDGGSAKQTTTKATS